ncbi:MAG: PEGA domain-containing protein [Vicinamibacterales bacterium]
MSLPSRRTLSEVPAIEPELGPDDDATLLFHSEFDEPPREPRKPNATPAVPGPVTAAARRRSTAGLLAILLLVVVAVAITAGLYLNVLRQPAPAPETTAPPVSLEGTAVITTRPDGVAVAIDGQPRGVTPLRLSLPAGDHTMELQNGTATRTEVLSVVAGETASFLVDLPPAPAAAAPARGRLDVASDPTGLPISVDGVDRGLTPLSLGGVNPGRHRVIVGTGDDAVSRIVEVTAGNTASVVVSVAPVGPSAGWVRLSSPVDLQVFENGRLIGTTGVDRLMLPAGQHDFELVGTEYEFRTTATALVQTGETITLPVSVPNGSLSINALPWAEVTIDGRPAGTTPLANLAVPIGRHEVVWRHPQLGERRQTVVVTARTPVRVGIDLNR